MNNIFRRWRHQLRNVARKHSRSYIAKKTIFSFFACGVIKLKIAHESFRQFVQDQATPDEMHAHADLCLHCDILDIRLPPDASDSWRLEGTCPFPQISGMPAVVNLQPEHQLPAKHSPTRADTAAYVRTYFRSTSEGNDAIVNVCITAME